MKIHLFAAIFFLVLSMGCDAPTDDLTEKAVSEAELKRDTFFSEAANSQREYFVYLPKGYNSNLDKKWPLLMFLHGNGERGNGQDELDFVLMQGPLYEAWIQKKDLPFIIISPQLPMFGFDKKGIDYISNRTKKNIPKRLIQGVPPRPDAFETELALRRTESVINMSEVEPLLPYGWEKIEKDLIVILDNIEKSYRVNKGQTYLSGLSYGGFGTWYMASKHPNRFAAIAPVVGWGHPSLMEPIAAENIPVWQFAGGRDGAIDIKYFYAGLDKLEQLGHNNLRFTVHEDKAHDAWTRVYSGDDLYKWFLSFEGNESSSSKYQ